MIRKNADGRLGGWSHTRFLAKFAAFDRLLEDGRSADAVALARTLLAEAEVGGEAVFPEAAYDLALCHNLMGQALTEAGNPALALPAYAEAERRFRLLAAGGIQAAERMVAVVLTREGDGLVGLGRLEEAAQAYEEAIGLAQSQNAKRQVAVAKGQLGTVRLHQGLFAEALTAHHEARETFEGFREPGSVATAWHQIGIIHKEAREFEAAEQAFVRAFSLWVREKNRAGEASTLEQLGLLYRNMNRLDDSVRFHGLATEISVGLGDLAHEGLFRNNMAVTYLDLGRHDEARRELLRAIECKGQFGHAAEPWTTFSLLEKLERETGNACVADEARAMAIQAFLAYRRDGGESTTSGGELCTVVAKVLAVGGDTSALGVSFSMQFEQTNLPAQTRALLTALQAFLAGASDPSLTDDPSLDYRDAAELRLLMEGRPASN